jgi:antitoxin ChpS
MITTTLRKVGGSVMMTLPPALLDLLQLRAGATVSLEVEGERLVVDSLRKPRYKLEALLAQCDTQAPATDEERAWLDSAPAGRELL